MVLVLTFSVGACTEQGQRDMMAKDCVKDGGTPAYDGPNKTYSQCHYDK